MKKDIISIIIPIYNSKSTLDRCVMSVMQQTYKDLEIILVDDGSTDMSGRICDNLQSIDNRIKVIHQTNQGVSATRNNGILHATGKYLQFVDSDDTIEKIMCEKLYNNIRDADLVICGYRLIGRSRIVEVNGICCKIKKIVDLKDNFSYLYANSLLNSPCNKLYLKARVKNQFDLNVSLGEDLLFNLDYIQDNQSIVFIKDVLYNYYIDNSDSLTKRVRENLFPILLSNYEKIRLFCRLYFTEKEKYLAIHEVFISNIMKAIQEIVYYKIEVKDILRTIKIWLDNDSVKEAIFLSKKKWSGFSHIIFIAMKEHSEKSIYILYKFKYFLLQIIKKVNGSKKKFNKFIA